MILPMLLPATLAWLIDEGSAADGPERILAAIGAQLSASGLPPRAMR